jgi:hypothetical protein
VADSLEEASENIAAISNICRGKGLSCDTKNFVWSDDHLAVRNTQNVHAEDEEEEEGGEEAAREQNISTKIRTH